MIFTSQQIMLLVLLAGLLVFFIWERWRYDLVALAALLLAVVGGLVPSEEAFLGFGHPAVITVAAVLIISKALSNAGAVEVLTRYVRVATRSPSLHVAVLSTLGGLISTVMNNVGALALLMPVAMQSSIEAKRSPAVVLMPLAFGSILGGMVTLIGTPPNIIVANYRAEIMGQPFSMFDFTPVGGMVALVGIVFVAFIGWHFIPRARRSKNAPQDLFQIQEYVTEGKVVPGSKAIGKSLIELEAATDDSDVQIIGLIRGEQSIRGAAWRERIEEGDVLILEAGPQGMNKFVSALGLELTGTQPQEEVSGADGQAVKKKKEEDTLLEAVVPPDRSWLVGRLAGTLKLQSRFGVTLLGVSRQGTPYRGRLKEFRFKAGDVLLLQGDKERIFEVIGLLGCLPLAERGIQLNKPRLAWWAGGIFGLSLASSMIGVLELPIALTGAALAMVLLSIVSPRDVYQSIDWPVLVLLGAMIPIGRAIEHSGVSTILAELLVGLTAGFPPVVLLGVIMVLTMTLSDVMNNAATAVVMAPLSVAVAQSLGVHPDPFLMAVAIGASCAFLTPIGHQNNLLVMGPGGYRFGDYWRMGLPLELLILLIGIPLLSSIWPLVPQ
ncbi:MAG: SLC13 family permease [Nitrospirales bacterium]